ncbi:MAG TPA: SEC-C metal-binding domain-containing protein [Planctomycetaceae bacterium]|jgi:hypothetical protein
MISPRIAAALLLSPLSFCHTVRPIVRGGGIIGRNQPCPCGSGKKFKVCSAQNHSREKTEAEKTETEAVG